MIVKKFLQVLFYYIETRKELKFNKAKQTANTKLQVNYHKFSAFFLAQHQLRGATKEQVSSAFKIILSDKKVKGILINIFGGIMRCDVLAKGLVEAVKESNLKIPLVVRLAGTNYEEGTLILKKSKLKILPALDLNDAAKKIINAIK